MGTFLFDKIVFGPVKSRRLGISLGINLLPVSRKYCNFDCIYCECGLNPTIKEKTILPSRSDIYSALKNKLSEMSLQKQLPDVITFAGNGEPTIHPDFADIIDDTIELRNTYCPSAAISVLSNATMLHKPSVIEALNKVDQNILKLDSGLEKTINEINKPAKKVDINTLIEQFRAFNGKVIIQSMFIRGEVNGKSIDNTKKEDIDALIDCILRIKPEKVMIYTIDRDTPFENLQKVSVSELNQISKKIEAHGITTMVSA